jgi:hypothetical protein
MIRKMRFKSLWAQKLNEKAENFHLDEKLITEFYSDGPRR